jgi:heterodisulfide reductase subunit B
MPQDYSYFPGCSLQSTGVAYDESVRALFALLDLKLHELPEWNCCGATSYMSIDEGSAFVLSARNLSLAAQAKHRDLVTPCSACYLVLKKTQDYVEHYPAIANKVQQGLQAEGLPPLNGVQVRHPLEILYNDVGLDRIKHASVRPWRGAPIACYYGCQLVRPYCDSDQQQNPTHMEEVLKAAGIPTVDFALKTKCCGGSLTGTIPAVGQRLNYLILKEAIRKGAGAIVTVCPLCQYNLDAYQADIRKSTGEAIDIPVLYFSQVLGWAMGADAKALGLQRSIAGKQTIKQWFAASEREEKAHV